MRSNNDHPIRDELECNKVECDVIKYDVIEYSELQVMNWNVV